MTEDATKDATIIEHVNAFKMLLSQFDFARAPMNEQIVQQVSYQHYQSYEGFVSFSVHQENSLEMVIEFHFQEEIQWKTNGTFTTKKVNVLLL